MGCGSGRRRQTRGRVLLRSVHHSEGVVFNFVAAGGIASPAVFCASALSYFLAIYHLNRRYLSEDGLPDIEKMQLIVFDPVHHGYVQLGDKVGQAFAEYKKL